MRHRKKLLFATLLVICAYTTWCFWPHSNPKAVRALAELRSIAKDTTSTSAPAPKDRGEWFRTRFLDPAGHPIFTTGAMVNRQFQPVDANGSTIYTNLWAAGGILARADPIRERSLEGLAIAFSIALPIIFLVGFVIKAGVNLPFGFIDAGYFLEVALLIGYTIAYRRYQ